MSGVNVVPGINNTGVADDEPSVQFNAAFNFAAGTVSGGPDDVSAPATPAMPRQQTIDSMTILHHRMKSSVSR
jgi:hypothetical protein